MRNKQLVPYRQRVAGGAEGRVLDIGIGSGFNLPFYGPQVGEIFGLDPSPQMLTRARNNAKQAHRNIQLLIGSAECIPLADRSFDTIVLTWVGCSIRCRCGLWRDAPSTEAGWTTALCRAWPLAGSGSRALAGADHAVMAAHIGRLPPQPKD